jgi:hypothetical protein
VNIEKKRKSNMERNLLHIEKGREQKLDNRIELTHYPGRLRIGCIVVMKRISGYITGLSVTLSEAKSPVCLTLTPTLSQRARELFGYFISWLLSLSKCSMKAPQRKTET